MLLGHELYISTKRPNFAPIIGEQTPIVSRKVGDYGLMASEPVQFVLVFAQPT